MSFINLMADDVWSEVDIVKRTESMISSEFSEADVAILNRKVTAAMIGQYQLTEEEQSQVERYAEVCRAAAVAGDEARADMALLRKTLDYEAAKAIVDNADGETLALASLRSPAPEPEATPEVVSE